MCHLPPEPISVLLRSRRPPSTNLCHRLTWSSIEVPSKYVGIHGLGMYAGSSASTTGMPRIFPANTGFGILAGKPRASIQGRSGHAARSMPARDAPRQIAVMVILDKFAGVTRFCPRLPATSFAIAGLSIITHPTEVVAAARASALSRLLRSYWRPACWTAGTLIRSACSIGLESFRRDRNKRTAAVCGALHTGNTFGKNRATAPIAMPQSYRDSKN